MGDFMRFTMDHWFEPIFDIPTTITKFLPDLYVDLVNGICIAKPKTFNLKDYHA